MRVMDLRRIRPSPCRFPGGLRIGPEAASTVVLPESGTFVTQEDSGRRAGFRIG